MVALRYADVRVLDDAFDMGSGYVLDFSDRTMAEFFDDEFNIDINQSKYTADGTSKAKRLRAFFKSEDAVTFSRVARRLWSYRETLVRYRDADNAAAFQRKLFELIVRVEAGSNVPRTDAIERFSKDETLEELVAAIERDINANKPVAAIDRLHTYCMKKFGHLLDQRQIEWNRNEPLHSRVGKYVKALGQERELRDLSLQIIRNATGVFDKYNHVRNNQSLAHDNELLNPAEARFIYDSVTALLRFIKSVEVNRFGV